MAVVSVEVGSFLVPVERVIGGVEIDDDFSTFSGDGFLSLLDDEVFYGAGIGDDFFVSSIGSLGGKFESIEGGVPSQSFACVVGVTAIFGLKI